MESQQYFLSESCFSPELQFGCVSLGNTDRLPLDGAAWTSDDGDIGLMLEGATGKPGLFDSAVAIITYRFPKGLAEFERKWEWHGKDRISRAKLPEGTRFDESVLAVREPPADWAHEAFAESGRTFVHSYRGKKQAVIIRWIARTGTVLDHPLFQPLIENLRIVPGQWVTDKPVIHPRNPAGSSARDTPLSAEVRTEIDEAAARARELLKLQRVRKPEKVAEAVYASIDEFRSRKKLKKEDKKQSAIDLGALWGEALCAAAGWEWTCAELTPQKTTHAVCSPNRSHIVDPLQVVFDLLSSRSAENNSLLLFNMIVSGHTPVSPANGYCWLR